MLIFSMAICSVQAQDEVQPQPKKSFLQKLVHYLDSSNVMGTDPDYIGLPEKKWCVTLNSSHNQISLNLDSHLEASADDQFDFNLRITPPCYQLRRSEHLLSWLGRWLWFLTHRQ